MKKTKNEDSYLRGQTLHLCVLRLDHFRQEVVPVRVT